MHFCMGYYIYLQIKNVRWTLHIIFYGPTIWVCIKGGVELPSPKLWQTRRISHSDLKNTYIVFSYLPHKKFQIKSNKKK